MADITLPHTITAATLAAAAPVQANFDELADKALNKTGDNMEATLGIRALLPTADNTYDVGSASYRVKDLYIAGSLVGPSSVNAFGTIAVSGQSNVVADAAGDTLTLVAGTGMTITTVAGTDTVTITASGTAVAGSSAINHASSGTIYNDQTTTGNVTTGADDLFLKSLAANLLAADGDRLTFRACGSFAATANNKRIKIKYGGTTILDMGASVAPNSAVWVATGTITRVASTTQRVEATLLWGGGAVSNPPVVGVTQASETLSGAVDFQITGEATDTNDIVMYAIAIDWYGRTTN